MNLPRRSFYHQRKEKSPDERFEQRHISDQWRFYQFSRISHFDSSRQIGSESVKRVMMSSLFLHIQPHSSRITGFPVHRAHAFLRYAGLSILEARERLNAICRKSASSAFLINWGNLARYALLYKWLNPKYCSTMYRTLEIALLRAVSYSVSSVPVVALRMMPSSILFMERNSRFGFPKYPLSAKTFLMGSLV